MENREYAGFWIRAGALAIDLVIMVVLLYIPLSFIYGEDYWFGGKVIYGFWNILLGYVVPVCATLWFWRRFMGTPGKMATRLRIVDAVTGEKMGMGQSIGRYFAYLLAMLPLGLGLFWVGFDKKKQGWHDKLAGTVVIRDR